MCSKQNVIAEALRLSEADGLEVAESLFASVAGPADPTGEAA